MTPDRRRIRGQTGEDAAAEWYRERGFSEVVRNWRCREGEIDLVVTRGRLLVFVEVKARTSSRFGTPAEAVTPVKAARLRVLGGRFLAEQPHKGDLRFDVAEVQLRPAVVVDVIEGAF